MINQGSKARTDSGDSGGIALSGAPSLGPITPCVDYSETVSEGTAARKRLFSYVLRLADAYRDRSERARVLLGNYSHVCRELGIRWQS